MNINNNDIFLIGNYSLVQQSFKLNDGSEVWHHGEPDLSVPGEQHGPGWLCEQEGQRGQPGQRARQGRRVLLEPGQRGPMGQSYVRPR